MSRQQPKDMNTTALAFLGDAVYEVYARKYVMDQGEIRADRLHRSGVKYVCADGQAKAVKSLMNDFLTEEEVKVVKRARNHKTTSKSRSASPVAYKLATAFEALVGYLYLKEDKVRLEAVVFEALKRIEE